MIDNSVTYEDLGLPQKPKSKGLGSKALLIAVLLAAAAVGALFATGKMSREAPVETAQAPAAPELPLVTFIVAQRGKPDTELLLPASILGMQEIAIYSRTTGYLKRYTVDIGDRVKEGQLIAEIETPELDQELRQVRAAQNQVKANLNLARATAERYKSLARQSAVSAQEVDEKVGAHEARKADFEATVAQIGRLEELKLFSRVVAPFPGTITARNVEVGSLIAAGTSSANYWLFKLVQGDPLRVMVSVPQSYVDLVHNGTDVEILLKERQGKAYTGKVVRMAGALDAATRTMLVEIRVPNSSHELMPGMYGQARFKLKNAQPPVILPGNTLAIGAEGARVVTLDASDTLHVRRVKLGRDYGKEVEIIEGINEGERIVMNPRDTLEEGMKVKAVAQ
jgi:RND family efflux transporter MFP subunit